MEQVTVANVGDALKGDTHFMLSINNTIISRKMMMIFRLLMMMMHINNNNSDFH